MWLETLGESCAGAGWKVHSFALMPNHYHLLIETLRPTLVKGMQYLNATYSRRFNIRHKEFGHVFQGRYKALLVDAEEQGYFLTVSDYIHLNPVRAGLVATGDDLLRVEWNSAGWLAGVRRRPPRWLAWQRVYGGLGIDRRNRAGQRAFREYVERRVAEILHAKRRKQPDGFDLVRRGWCLGSEHFVVSMKARLEEVMGEGVHPERWNSEAVEEMEEERAGRLLQRGFRVLSAGKELTGLERYLLARWVRQHSRVSVGWLAQQLGLRTRGGMASGIYLVGQRQQIDLKLARKWKALEALYDAN
jgi:REP element-mobilizing transposase RayT